MILAKPPNNEKERLHALYKYDILDTEAEKVFDDLTELASEICETPIALISLIDPDRQWFKSKVGLEADETSRDIAFCAHAIHQDEILEIPDTLKDERFHDNPLVTTSPNIRFYAGTPLQTPDGLAIGTLCAISDKPKTLNKHQRKALEILGREVISQLELRLKVKELKEVNSRKTDFLSNLSHELRTPLNAIVNLGMLMLNDKSFTIPQKHKEYLENLNYSGKLLLNLVNSVLDLNKIEAGKFELNPCTINIEKFFTSIEGLVSSIASSKKVNVDFSVSQRHHSHVLIDETRFCQVILNLVSNAIKFSQTGQTVLVNLAITKRAIILGVKDFGSGIAEKDIPLLFTKFQQVGDNHEGSGLGLMITKSIVDTMGGKIRLNSLLGKGTLIKVTVPLKPSKSNIEHENPAIERTFNTNSRLLVVEDNDINQVVATEIFKSIGLNIDLCTTGEEALDRITTHSYDLIFMDIHLPSIDGFETSRRIKEALPNQPIVALTADVFANDDKKLNASGMICSLNKPINVELLVSILSRYCTS